MHASEMKDSKRAKHRFPWKAADTTRRHLMASHQEVSDPIVDVIVDRPVGWHSGAIAKICDPTAKQTVEPVLFV